ncbi:MAG: hypothetical protein IT167_06715 [Bryobacterales bacterium]|nr:hypothetical protein [Bryobacterales bacterium]
MTPEFWREVEETFHGALAQSVETRAEWLAESCRGNRDLLGEVQSLIAADGLGLEREIRGAVITAALLVGLTEPPSA